MMKIWIDKKRWEKIRGKLPKDTYERYK